MATALVSLLTDRPVRPLTGDDRRNHAERQRLPVGGIKEKVLAAKRAGVRDVILPAENKTNVEDHAGTARESERPLREEHRRGSGDRAAVIAWRRKTGCRGAGEGAQRATCWKEQVIPGC